MKPTNRFYLGDYMLDPPDEPEEDLVFKCTYCGSQHDSKAWRANRGSCLSCDRTYAGKHNED